MLYCINNLLISKGVVICLNFMGICTMKNNLVVTIYNTAKILGSLSTANGMHDINIHVLFLYTITIYTHCIFIFNVFVPAIHSLLRYFSPCYLTCRKYCTLPVQFQNYFTVIRLRSLWLHMKV